MFKVNDGYFYGDVHNVQIRDTDDPKQLLIFLFTFLMQYNRIEKNGKDFNELSSYLDLYIESGISLLNIGIAESLFKTIDNINRLEFTEIALKFLIKKDDMKEVLKYGKTSWHLVFEDIDNEFRVKLIKKLIELNYLDLLDLDQIEDDNMESCLEFLLKSTSTKYGLDALKLIIPMLSKYYMSTLLVYHDDITGEDVVYSKWYNFLLNIESENN